MRSPIVGAVLCLGLAACSPGSPSSTSEAPIVISQGVWNAYEQYLQTGTPGAFAVAADGRHAGLVYCIEDACRHGFVQVRQTAVVTCERSGGSDCRVFAEGTRIVVPYRVE